jgi:hypothetical protein
MAINRCSTEIFVLERLGLFPPPRRVFNRGAMYAGRRAVTRNGRALDPVGAAGRMPAAAKGDSLLHNGAEQMLGVRLVAAPLGQRLRVLQRFCDLTVSFRTHDKLLWSQGI